ncbi:VTT domain-containing protein, partial [Candidatus Microgenomates bacterium]|nr:VTT domain-containing protein [Candidatus Microgenomates bacterium]
MTQYLHPEFLIRTFGYIGIFSIVFAESGLFFGFFLPGDSLLVTAGLFAAKGELNITVLILLCVVGAILGDTVGFTFGHKTGPMLFNREDSKCLKKSHIEKAKSFYDKHGGKTIILARFMPFIRTFAPIVAGAAQMHYPSFLSYNVIGGIV